MAEYCAYCINAEWDPVDDEPFSRWGERNTAGSRNSRVSRFNSVVVRGLTVNRGVSILLLCLCAFYLTHGILQGSRFARLCRRRRRRGFR